MADANISATPQFLVGTASWTDPTLVKSDLFYPPAVKTAHERLRFYAENFRTVEVDSSYYALPSERNSRLWVERTPEDFVFNIKAFGWLTQHAADTTRLPNAIKEVLPSALMTERRIKDPPSEVLDLAFQMFWSALGPLRDAGKLGKLLFQFPPYFTYRKPIWTISPPSHGGCRERQSQSNSAIQAGSRAKRARSTR